MSDPYRVLRLAPGASADEIERAYHKLVRRYPPELNPQRFADIHRAYKQLTSLDPAMGKAFEKPHTALEQLFPPPVAHLRPANDPLPSTDPPDFEPLIHGLRRQLLGLVLRSARPGPKDDHS